MGDRAQCCGADPRLDRHSHNKRRGQGHDSTHNRNMGQMGQEDAVAISVLQDQRLTYKEDFAGFTFTKFDGTKITV